MSRLFFVLTLVCIHCGVFSQGIKWSGIRQLSVNGLLQLMQLEDCPSVGSLIDFHKASDTGIVYALDEEGHFSIFDEEMRLVSDTLFEYVEGEYKEVDFQGLISTTSNQCYALFSGKLEDEKWHVFIRKLDKERHTLGQPIKLYDSPHGKQRASLSKDGTKLLFYYTEEISEEDYRYNFAVFDQSFELSWKKSIRESSFGLSKKKLGVLVDKITIDNSGTICLLASPLSSNKMSDISPSLYLIKKEEDLRRLDLFEGFPNKRVFSNKVDFDLVDQELVVTGFYMDTEVDQVEGFYYGKFSTVTLEPIDKKLHPYNEEFIDIFRRKEGEKGREKAIEASRAEGVLGCFYHKNYGAFLITERSWYHEYRRGESIMSAKIFGDIRIIKFDKDGQMSWFKTVINKSQEVMRFGYTAFCSSKYILAGDEIVFFYNEQDQDDQRILNVKQLNFLLDSGSSKSKIIASGSVKSGNKKSTYIVPMQSYTVDEHEIIFRHAMPCKKYRLGRYRF